MTPDDDEITEEDVRDCLRAGAEQLRAAEAAAAERDIAAPTIDRLRRRVANLEKLNRSYATSLLRLAENYRELTDELEAIRDRLHDHNRIEDKGVRIALLSDRLRHVADPSPN